MGKNSRLNTTYTQMKKRCYDTSLRQYKNYGGRGITVCPEWNDNEIDLSIIGHPSKGFLVFKEWALTHGYREDLTLDRIDVNKGYSPENCRWVTMKVQCNNRRSNLPIKYEGRTQNLKQWCEELNLNYKTVYSRLTRYHWPIEKIFNK